MERKRATVLYRGDCSKLIAKMPDNSVDLTVTSPPYCIGKEYDQSRSVDDFIADQGRILPEVVRITKPGGSICWQVGYHMSSSSSKPTRRRVAYPLDFAVFKILHAISGVALRNRLVWTFGHGTHALHRFSGRHETIMWFTKGEDYFFDLDGVREPQKYPGKKNYKGPRKGQYSGNPLGKNPGDVWDIPNVRSNHVEKLGHPCQFPIAIAHRLVRALSPKDGLVFDPYAGSSSTGVAAIYNGRRFIGAEIKAAYVRLSEKRLRMAQEGTAPYRPIDRPIFIAGPNLAVAKRPSHFLERSK